MNKPRILLLAFMLLLSSLACRAAVQLIYGETPTPSPTALPTASPSPIATLPSPTSTLTADCPDEMSSIITATNNGPTSPGDFPSVDTGDQADIPLVLYTVNGDTLKYPIMEKIPSDLQKYQDDKATQTQAWNLFVQLIPAGQRSLVHEYEVITDGPGGVLAAVEQTSSDPKAWMLEVDIADAPDTKNLAFTLLHEFGHLLSLNSTQVPPDFKIFYHPSDQGLYNQEAAACPNYFPGPGCSLRTSYINAFFNRFWTGLYDEWQAIDAIQNDTRRHNKLKSFYYKYQDQFVDDYAVTDPSEDLAETWAYFLLSPKPQGTSIAEQKLDFFYGYPELVQLRQQILTNLCAANP